MGKEEIPTTPERSRLMSRVKQEGSSAELRVREIVTKLGKGFETNRKELPGSPDLVNIHEKWSIFVHGCFWHAHKGCRRWKIPKTNSEFWKIKFDRNRERDAAKINELKSDGFRVCIIWECESNEDVQRKLIELFKSRKSE